MGDRGWAVVLAALTLGAGCSSDTSPRVSDAVLGTPTGPNAALYFRVDGYGDGDRLVSITTDVAERAELHETVTDADGTTTMTPVDGFDVPARGEGRLELAPGGAHVMLVDVQRLDVGDRVEVAVTFQRAGEVVFEAEVVEPESTVDHDH